MSEAIELSPTFATFKKRWRVLVAFVVVFLLLGLGYAFFWPAIWQADTILLPNMKDAEAGSLGSILSPNAATPLSIMKGALESRSAVDAIMSATGLERLPAQSYLNVTPDEHTDELLITAKDNDHKRALAAVRAAVQILQAIYSRTASSSASLQAKYLESDLADKTVLLHQDEKKVADFASNLNIVADPTASASEFYLGEYQKQQYMLNTLDKELEDLKAQASHVATKAGDLPTGLAALDEWRTKAVELNYQYQATVRNLGPQNPEALRLKTQLEQANATMSSEQGKYLKSVQGGVDKDIATLEIQRDQAKDSVAYLRKRVREAPGLSLQFKKLADEAGVQEKVVDALREKYEEAKVEAEVSQVKFSVLDAPYVEDLPLNHRPFRYGMLGTISGLVIGSIFILMREKKLALIAPESSGKGLAA